MSQYKISKKRLAEIIKEEYKSLQEVEDPRSPSPMSWEHEGSADDFRTQIMNLVLQLGPLTLDPKTAAAVEVEIRDVLNTLRIGTDPRSKYRQEESLTGDQKEMDEDGDGDIDEKDLALKRRKKRPQKESIASIRDLIQQELQKL